MFNKHCLIAVLLFIFVYTGVLIAATDQEALVLFTNARNCENQGKDSEARSLFEQIITNYPLSLEMRRATVRIARMDIVDLIHNKKFNDASAKILTIISDYNDCNDVSWFLYSAASTYDEIKKREDAAHLYALTIARNGISKLGVSATIKLARLQTLSLIQSGQYDEADAKFSKVYSLYPKHNDLKWYIYSVASYYDELKQREKAYKYYNLYIQTFGDDALGKSSLIKASRLKVLSLISNNYYDEADVEVSEVINKYSGNNNLKWYLFSIASKYHEINEKYKANEYYKICIQLFPNDTMGAIAKLKSASIDISEALNSNENVVSVIDNFKEVLQNLQSTAIDANWHATNKKECLYKVACLLDEKGYTTEAARLYDMFTNEFSGDKLISNVYVRRQRIKMIGAINAGKADFVINDVNVLVDKYYANKALPWTVYSCACHFDEKGYLKEAAKLYDVFMRNFPDSEFAEAVLVKSNRLGVVGSIKSSDVNSFETSCMMLDLFKQSFRNSEHFVGSMINIAEAYYKPFHNLKYYLF